jgi:hypothetical protein
VPVGVGGYREASATSRRLFSIGPNTSCGRNKYARRTKMDGRIIGVFYAVVTAAVIVGVDFAFFRDRFWERLIVNVGIVLVFGAFYLRFLKQ